MITSREECKSLTKTGVVNRLLAVQSEVSSLEEKLRDECNRNTALKLRIDYLEEELKSKDIYIANLKKEKTNV